MPKKKSSAAASAAAASPAPSGEDSAALSLTPAKATSSTHDGMPASPSSSETPAAANARIISHMNADHPDSLARYIQHFGGVWALSARAPELVKLDRTSMTIASTGPVGTASTRGLHTTISFEPALKTGLSDARTRLIEMDREAMRALGRNDVTIHKYLGPRKGWEWFWVGFVAFSWVFALRRQNTAPDSWLMAPLPANVATFLRTWQPRVLRIMVGLHAIEGVEMAWSKLRVYNVELFSPVWWRWMLDVLFAGFPVWDRLKQVIDEERETKRKTMH